jgi:hypothetical protein
MLAQADARPAAILWNELDATGFKSMPNIRKRPIIGRSLFGFEVGEGSGRHFRPFGKLLTGPPEHGPCAPALLGRDRQFI